MKRLSTDYIKRLSTDYMKRLSTDYMKRLSTDFIKRLSTDYTDLYRLFIEKELRNKLSTGLLLLPFRGWG